MNSHARAVLAAFLLRSLSVFGQEGENAAAVGFLLERGECGISIASIGKLLRD